MVRDGMGIASLLVHSARSAVRSNAHSLGWRVGPNGLSRYVHAGLWHLSTAFLS